MIPGFVLWFFMVPGQFISELSAGGAKPDVENTPKGTRLTFILAPRSRPLGLAGLGRLWPSDDDDEDDGDDGCSRCL